MKFHTLGLIGVLTLAVAAPAAAHSKEAVDRAHASLLPALVEVKITVLEDKAASNTRFAPLPGSYSAPAESSLLSHFETLGLAGWCG